MHYEFSNIKINCSSVLVLPVCCKQIFDHPECKFSRHLDSCKWVACQITFCFYFILYSFRSNLSYYLTFLAVRESLTLFLFSFFLCFALSISPNFDFSKHIITLKWKYSGLVHFFCFFIYYACI